jgi:hypothetical protein
MIIEPNVWPLLVHKYGLKAIFMQKVIVGKVIIKII